MQHLKGIAAEGETLLQLSLVCRKNETEREQLLPLGLPPLPKPMFEEAQTQEEVEEIKRLEQPSKLEEVSLISSNCYLFFVIFTSFDIASSTYF